MKVIIRKILWIIIAICVLCFAGYQAVRMYIERKLDLVETATAAHDITPRTKIKAEDIVMAEVPAAYLLSGTFTKASDLIGLYTDIRSYIPAGSPFYTSMLKEEKDLPDQPSLQVTVNDASPVPVSSTLVARTSSPSRSPTYSTTMPAGRAKFSAMKGV